MMEGTGAYCVAEAKASSGFSSGGGSVAGLSVCSWGAGQPLVNNLAEAPLYGEV